MINKEPSTSKGHKRNSSKSKEKFMYKNYMSNRNPIAPRDSKSNYKKLANKRGSCQNTKESGHQSSISKLNLTLSDTIMHDREKWLKFINLSIQKHQKIPATTLDFYKIVKLIGKGAFGKVALGIHKLTGKQVAIKIIEKSYMKDEFSRRKVFQEVYILK